jgi:hypothetical protein
MEDFVNAIEYWSTEYPKLQQGGGESSDMVNSSGNIGGFQA